MAWSIFRLPASILDTGQARAGSKDGREALRRRNWQAQQVVDVLPEEAFYEQVPWLKNR
jgi:hypothetical protein